MKTYGAETWALTKYIIKKIQGTEKQWNIENENIF